jgi:SAM-dependent methyltransferase
MGVNPAAGTRGTRSEHTYVPLLDIPHRYAKHWSGVRSQPMDHADHVELLRPGVEGCGGAWADIGAGSGAFTLALADLLGPSGEIYAIDRDAGALRQNARAMRRSFPQILAHHLEADFARPLSLPPLDGIVMANALHFEREQAALVRRLSDYLRPGGHLVIVEYNIAQPNRWVPHPVPYTHWEPLARDAGFQHVEMLARRPSRTFGEIYSALAC